MKKLQRYFLLILLAISLHLELQAQNLLIPESVKESCPEMPVNQKVKLAVARFSQSSNYNYGRNVENFATMLSNAMFEINCFRMLSTIQDNNYHYTGKETRDILPHFIITGEITEYNHKVENINAILVRKTVYKAHIGFILQIKDPITREIIFSKSFNQEGSKEQTDLQVTSTRSNPQSVSNSYVDQAYQDAFEKGILEAVTYIVEQRERIYEMANMILNSPSESGNQYTLKVQQTTFTAVNEIVNTLKAKSPTVLHVDKTFSHTTGVVTVIMKGTTDQLVEILTKSFPGRVNVTEFAEDRVTITFK